MGVAAVIIDGKKQCPCCKEMKESDQFGPNRATKTGWDCYCKPCRKIKRTAHRATEQGKAKQRLDATRWYAANKEKKLEKEMIKKYGITRTDFNRMLENQNHACAICKTSETGAYTWHIDHDHKTGKIRGLLCGHCNRGLGIFKDSPELLVEAAEYLRRHQS